MLPWRGLLSLVLAVSVLVTHAAASSVSVQAGSARDGSGRVWVRVINGSPLPLSYGLLAFRLEHSTWYAWKPGWRGPQPPHADVVFAVARHLSPGAAIDETLPRSQQPLPPDTYRVCFQFHFFVEHSDDGPQVVCSPAFHHAGAQEQPR